MTSLFWHAQPKQLILRGYEPGKSFDRRDPFSAVITVDLFGAHAVGSAMLRQDGQPLSRRDMLQIAALVRQYGGQVMLAERSGKLVKISEPISPVDPPANWNQETVPVPL